MKRPIIITLLVFALLCVLAGIGASLFFTFGPFRGGDPFRVRDVLRSRNLISATTEETKTLNTDGPITLNVQNDAGVVSIVGSEGDEMTVNVVKTGFGRTQAEAERDLENIEYEIQQTGDAITLTYKLATFGMDDAGDTVDFIITVPFEAGIDVESGFGEVSVSNTNGEVSIANNFGEVTVQNIEGGLTVNTESGQVEASSINAGSENIELTSGFGTVSLEKASGQDIRLESDSGALEMDDVRASGTVEMTTDFGDTRFTTGSAHVLTIETKSGKVTLNTLNLRGALTAKSDFGEISLEQVNAVSYDLQTSSGSITVDGTVGNLKAHSGFGSVLVLNGDSVTLDLSTQSGSVDFEGSLGEGPHTIRSNFGEINLTIPADSALDVDLKTDFGSIKSDIPISVILTGEAEQNHQVGTMNDGGSQLTVETSSGSISIRASQ
ncbi:MAG TPA: DUF4097 family beta strand repeat-containing protein [Anaerolineales bacterium]|nr:DUF4097 family beta strand repeat-containing protein [Anaerolineales bacterium]